MIPVLPQSQPTLPSKTDIFLFEGGANDKIQGVPIGTDINSRDTNTYVGAVNYVLDYLQEKYPKALIICITPWYVGDGTEDYADAMMAVCAARGIVCFDATDQEVTGVYMNDPDFMSQYCWSLHHLNPEGMKIVFPAFDKFITDEYYKFVTKNK